MNTTTTVSTAMDAPPKRTSPATPARSQLRRGRRRRWLPYLGGTILVALIVAGLWPRPLPVETASVATGPLRATVSEEGKTRIRQRFVVSAPVNGQLQRIPFKAGAEVVAGQPMAAIAPLVPTMLDARTRALAEARRDTAAANLDRARAAHKFAANELERFTRLFADKTISIQEFEQFQWREVSAAKELAAAEAALRQAEAELAEFTKGSGAVRAGESLNGSAPAPSSAMVEVRAPVAGRVLRLFEESSRAVTSGTPLLEIGDPTDLEVVIEALSRDGAMIQPGTRVELEQWGGQEPLQARVRLVEPAAFTKISALGVEEQRVNVIADIVTPPDRRVNLGDNFRVEAQIVMWETNQVLKVPSGALFRHGEDRAVFVVKDGRAVVQPVRTGRSSGTETQILDGLNPGDVVVMYPGDRIRAGARLRPLQIKP